MLHRTFSLLLLLTLPLMGSQHAMAQPAQQGGALTLAKLKYGGGGDWYANPTALPNLFEFLKEKTGMDLNLEETVVEPGSAQLFNYPLVYLTGHGNITFSEQEARNLRRYLEAGGFLFADDNYGMHDYFREAMKAVFPDEEFEPLPANHPVYQQLYRFPKGMPKIHEHDQKPAQAYGLFHQGRLVCLLTYEADLGDGWEDPEVHNDPEEVRQKALQMGANVVLYVLNE